MFQYLLLLLGMYKIACVVLVDDDSLNNIINRKFFSKIDLINHVEIIDNSTTAMLYIDAYFLAHKKLPEYIITDINMPDISGFKFIENFRSKYPEAGDSVRIIFMSASINKNDIIKLRHIENVNYIEKPFTKDKLEKLFSICQAA